MKSIIHSQTDNRQDKVVGTNINLLQKGDYNVQLINNHKKITFK